MESIDDLIVRLGQETRERFEREGSILSFQQYLDLVRTQPYLLSRNTAQYAADMMDHWGSRDCPSPGGASCRRFRLFDDPWGEGEFAMVGQEEAQNEIYRCLREFVQRRQIDKMLLLHGPNGSAKSTLVNALVRGLEHYSLESEGALFRFNWVFSEAGDRGDRLGFNPVSPEERLDSFAFLEADRISAKIPSDMHDHPLLLIPRHQRLRFLEEALAGPEVSQRERFVATRFLVEGELSPKFRSIYLALLRAYRGDWRKVVRHVQVERYTISRRFRSGAVTIEPQAVIDARSRQIGHATMKGLPPVLQNETLFEAQGDLVDANRGLVEYSDFFKRPIEANKYLLTTAESGMMNLSSYTAFLDLLMIGTSNENYLSAFRRDPLFPSFKGRMELIRVPYILEYPKERQIYDRHFSRLPAEIHVAPHTTTIAAMWAVMTRLMPPLQQGADAKLKEALAGLTPLEKAKFYGDGSLPHRLSDEEKALMRNHLDGLRHEYDHLGSEFEGMWDAAYEGRRGCSPREMITMLSEMALNPPGMSLTPLLVLRTIPELTRDASLYQFLRIEPSGKGYHDCKGFLAALEHEYLGILAHDVERAADLVEEEEFGRLFRRYFLNVKAFKTKEKVLEESSGRYLDPDRGLMERIETLLGREGDAEEFRSNLMTKAAAFKLENPDRAIDYDLVFSDLLDRLRRSVFRERLARVQDLVEDVAKLQGLVPGKLEDEARAAATTFVGRMTGELGYNEYGLIEALQFLRRNIGSLK
ncbi:MAG: serine protein kinase PrkA [Planctomycetes bacterium]|nr:serine protein kinase PrkA [Planctomycetota bacterium]